MTSCERILAMLPGAKPSGNGWMACCPAHQDSNPSLSISAGEDGRALLHCHAGCTTEAIVAALGLELRDLMPLAGDKTPINPGKREVSSPSPSEKSRKVHPDRKSAGHAALWSMKAKKPPQHWDYHNLTGTVVGTILRCDQPDGSKLIRPLAAVDGGWVVGHMPEPRPLFKRPTLKDATQVIVCEGEKAAEAGVKLGLVCTTSAGGAQAAHQTDWTPLANVDTVVLIPDQDTAGEAYVRDVLQELAKLPQRPKAYILRLPGLSVGGDLYDWVAARPSQPVEELRKELEALIATATAVDFDKLTRQPSTSRAAIPDEEVAPEEQLEYQPFPACVLPSPMREFVEEGARALGCDPAYLALPLLSALASAVGNTRRIQLKTTWCEPCVIWTVVVGESGTLKSPALDLALENVRRRQAAEFTKHLEELLEYEQQLKIYKVDLSEWEKKRRKASVLPPEKPEPPVLAQNIAEDCTVEAMAERLQSQPRGILLARDELSGWINSFDAYKSARGADVAHWLSMHRAGSVLVNRKTGTKIIRVPRAAVSVCGGIQPLTLKAALEGRYTAKGAEQMAKPPAEHFANGFAARLLLANPPRVPKRWTEDEIAPAVMDAMARLFDVLYALEAPVDDNGDLVPVDLPLTPEAKLRWIAFFNSHAAEQTQLNDELAAAWSKGEGYAPRFALLFELITNPMSEVISAESMEAGIELARWFMDEAARVYADLGGNYDSPDAREARELGRVVEWMESRSGVATVRDLTNGPRKYRKNLEEAEQVFRKLEELGLITKVGGTTKPQGGRPTQWYMLATKSLKEVGPLLSPGDDEDGDVCPHDYSGDGDETSPTPENNEVSSPLPPPTDDQADRVRRVI